MVQLPRPPDGAVCRGSDGVKINLGDKVRITNEEEIEVCGIQYWGYEDRSEAELWEEPGFLLEFAWGSVPAKECKRVET